MNLGCIILTVASAISWYLIATSNGLQRRNRIVWCPNKFIFMLFCIYSPAHAMIWNSMTLANGGLRESILHVRRLATIHVRPRTMCGGFCSGLKSGSWASFGLLTTSGFKYGRLYQIYAFFSLFLRGEVAQMFIQIIYPNRLPPLRMFPPSHLPIFRRTKSRRTSRL